MNNNEVLNNLSQQIIDDLTFWDLNFASRKTKPIQKYDLAGRLNPQYKIQKDIIKSNMLALKEPFDAYVKVLNENQIKIYYFCRRDDTAKSNLKETKNDVDYISYKAPLGRIASQEVRTRIRITTPIGPRIFEILEKNLFTPKKYKTWDGITNKVEIQEGKFTIKSLRGIIDPDTNPMNFETENELFDFDLIEEF